MNLMATITLLLTKSDLVLDKSIIKKLSINIPLIQISSITGENLNKAVQAMANILQSYINNPEISSN